MVGPGLFVLSLIAAASAIWIVRRDRFITFGIFLVYVVWHVPVVLTAIMPLDVSIKSPENRPYVVGLLALIHVIVWSGVVGYLSAGRWTRRRAPVYQVRFDRIFVILASAGAFFVAIDAFVFRTDLSLDIGANRAAYSNVESASPFGQIAILLGGFALLLLLAKPFGLKTFLRNGIPYVLYSTMYLLVGNRQFMLMGIILLVLTFVASRRPPLVRTVAAGLFVALAFFVLMTAFGAARQSATKGVQDVALSSLMNFQITDYSHPLMTSYATRTAALYLYLYYGIEYEMAGSIMRNVDVEAPPLSLTVPIVYRRFSRFLGWPDQLSVMTATAQEVENTLGVYPNVWATMFTQVYYEAGPGGVGVFGAVLAIAHLLLVRSLVRGRRNGTLNILTIFYACIVFGIMFAPTREGSITSLLFIVAGLALFQAVVGTGRAREQDEMPATAL